MNILRGVKDRPKTMKQFNFMADRCGVTEEDVQSWIDEKFNGKIPTIYYECYCEQIDVDRWSDSKDVFTSSGEHARGEDYREGDILELAEMPFDKNGCHASGYSIWGKAAAGNYCWIDEFEED